MIGNKKIITVVTARGGSKGIPRKNVRLLLGQPLFMWSVMASLESKYVDLTVVSSNCNEVYREYKKFSHSYTGKGKHMFIKRPDVLSGDLSKNEQALIHAVDYMVEQHDEKFGIVCNLQPTSPCRNKILDHCLEEYDRGGHDSLLTGKKETPFIWQKINGKWKYTVDKNNCCDRKMRQEFLDDEFNSELILHDCGNIYITDKDVLLNTKCRIGKNPCVFAVDELNSLQIDTEFDFQLIEQMAKVNNLKSLI